MQLLNYVEAQKEKEADKEKIREIYKSSETFRAFMEEILHLVEDEDLLNEPYNDLHKLLGCFEKFSEHVDYITEVLNYNQWGRRQS